MARGSASSARRFPKGGEAAPAYGRGQEDGQPANVPELEESDAKCPSHRPSFHHQARPGVPWWHNQTSPVFLARVGSHSGAPGAGCGPWHLACRDMPGAGPPHNRSTRTKSAATGKTDAYELTETAGMERDGVQHGTFAFKALKVVEVKVTMPAERVGLFHTSYDYHWNVKRTETVSEGYEQAFRFYASVRIGDHEETRGPLHLRGKQRHVEERIQYGGHPGEQRRDGCLFGHAGGRAGSRRYAALRPRRKMNDNGSPVGAVGQADTFAARRGRNPSCRRRTSPLAKAP